jgi:hypothetical protein
MDVFVLSDKMESVGITRSEVAREAGRSLGHVSMCLNGQRAMSVYLAGVVRELIEEREAQAAKGTKQP